MEDWKANYEKMLEDENVEYSEVKEFVLPYMPPKLYRYRSFDKYYSDNIFKGLVYISCPAEYNDPYDSAVSFDYDEYFVNKTGIEKEEMQCLTKQKKIDDILDKHRKDTFNNFRHYIKTACFCESKSSMLMWSHYAANHSGFCIEYDTSMTSLFKELALPVIYKKTRYDATRCIMTLNKNIACNPVLYKSKDWEYEQEWRIYGTKDYWEGKNTFLDLKEAITAVYLGATPKSKDRDKIQEVRAWGKNNNISIHNMELGKKTYNLITY